MLDLTQLFNHDGEHLELNDWVNQVVMTIGHPVLLPKKFNCIDCSNEIIVEGSHNDMSLIVSDKVVIRHKCTCSTKMKLTDVSSFLENEENTFKIYEVVDHTIKDIIKSYANKNGGTHVDKSLSYNKFADVFLGENYLIAIANYILGVLSFKAKSKSSQ